MRPWRGRANAEIYDRFVRDHRIYRELNRRVAGISRLHDSRRVLDLACGTGATALACLRLMDFQSDLVGVDASEDMVEVARANILDPRARFLVAPAASVDRVVEGPFDRAVCCAAFWQFPAPGAVLKSVGKLLSHGGLFVFNVPAERITGESAPVHPFQVALARVIESRTRRPFPITPAGVDPVRLVEMMADAGLELETRERFAYRGRQSELMDLMEIPAMIAPLAPELSAEEREEAAEEARARTDPDELVEVPWIYFVARRP
jgi:SAM-dependent methyltransferase